MNAPRKHHYCPVFYLKQWTGNDDRLCEYKGLPGQVVTKRTFPDGTGYERDLYRIGGYPEVLAQQFESKFLRMVDTDAKHALDKIISGDQTPWNPKMRSAWVRFILSLRFRNPEAVHLLKSHMDQIWKAATDRLRADYDKRRLPTDPKTFEEYIALTKPNAPHLSAFSILEQIIDNAELGPTLFHMDWTKISLGDSKHSLLTSDRPLNGPYGLASKDAYIVLPIGPKTLFIAAHDDRATKQLSATNADRVVRAMNDIVVRQARKFVWGIDDSQHRFVEKRISALPDKPIISEEQRRKAIEAEQTG